MPVTMTSSSSAARGALWAAAAPASAAQPTAVRRAVRDTTERLMGTIRTNKKIWCYEITSRLVKRRLLRDRV
jgi:uncharacterized protein involved in copper resistance